MWFVMFFVTVGFCLLALATVLESHLPLGDDERQAFDIAAMLACGAALLTGYGFLSRWFERQADVYAARTLEKPLAEQGNPQGLGAAVFASALERVAIVNNIPMHARNWTHGSIAARVRYIHRLGRDPVVAQRFDRTGRWVFFGLVALIAVCGTLGTYLAIK
jgi:Zn-dependent protease with chaperone function